MADVTLVSGSSWVASGPGLGVPKKITIEAWGAGGGGGSGVDFAAGGGGGGGGAYAKITDVPIIPGTTYSYVIGLKGYGNIISDGTDGGSTSFSSVISAAGGKGGKRYANGYQGGAGGLASSCIGSTKFSGGTGGAGCLAGAGGGGGESASATADGNNGSDGTVNVGGAGGTGSNGYDGAIGGVSHTNGGNAISTNYGAGGGGAGHKTGEAERGGDGAGGIILITYTEFEVWPTVTQNTPINGGTYPNTTPGLKFTGTDANLDEMDFILELDTVPGFNSNMTSWETSESVAPPHYQTGQRGVPSGFSDDTYSYSVFDGSGPDLWGNFTIVFRTMKANPATVNSIFLYDHWGGSIIGHDAYYVYVYGGYPDYELHRINKSDWSTVISCALPNYFDYCGGYVDEGNHYSYCEQYINEPCPHYIYMVGSTHINQNSSDETFSGVIRVSLRDFSTTSSLDVWSRSSKIAYDEDYLYIASWNPERILQRYNDITHEWYQVGANSPGQISKIEKSSFVVVTNSVLPDNTEGVYCICVSQNYIFIGSRATYEEEEAGYLVAKLIRVNKIYLDQASVLDIPQMTSIVGSWVGSVSSYGNFVYATSAGLQDGNGCIARISVDSFSSPSFRIIGSGASSTPKIMGEDDNWLYTYYITLEHVDPEPNMALIAQEVKYRKPYSIPLVTAYSYIGGNGTFWGELGARPFASGEQVTYTVAFYLSTEATYYWRVRAVDLDLLNIAGSWSPTWSFRIAPSDYIGGHKPFPTSCAPLMLV
jgi:hypothetical protein